MKDIRVIGLAKAFGTTPAVDHVSFEVPAGSLATLLGPSGCGKTTTLRLLAGLEKPDAGEVYVGDRCLTSAARTIFLSPEKRRMGMVFQSYAIWPHMTVFENIAFPLREKRDAGDRDSRAGDGHAADARAATASTIVRLPCSRAASSSAWRSAGRWSPIPTCCSSTSRSPTWTRGCARRCAWSSRSCRRGSASPRCSSRTIRPRP